VIPADISGKGRFTTPAPLTRIAQQLNPKVLPWALLLFLYVPMIYWVGFALKAHQVLDYPSFYFAARLALLDGRTPYGSSALDDYSVALDRWLPPFVYPPPSLLAFWPLTAFTLQGAFIVFTIVSHLCLLGTIWLICTRLCPRPEDRHLKTLSVCALIAYMLLSDAVPATLSLGQINIIAGFFVCLALVSLIEDRPAWRIAWPLCIAILLKTYPVLLLMLLAVRKRYRAAALTVAFYGVFVVVAAIVLPTHVWTSWRAEVLPAAAASKNEVQLFSHSNVSFIWNQSITGFLTQLLGDRKHPYGRLFHPVVATQLAHLLSVLLMGVTVLMAFRARQRTPRAGATLDDVAAFVLMVYLVAPVSWDHHLVFIFPATCLTLALMLNGEVRGKTGVVLGVALCLIAWRMNLDASLFTKRRWNLLGSTKFFSVMTLWAFYAQRLYRSGRKPIDTDQLISQAEFPEASGESLEVRPL